MLDDPLLSLCYHPLTDPLTRNDANLPLIEASEALVGWTNTDQVCLGWGVIGQARGSNRSEVLAGNRNSGGSTVTLRGLSVTAELSQAAKEVYRVSPCWNLLRCLGSINNTYEI
eukprot:114812-Hanusia_phi.AAC.1